MENTLTIESLWSFIQSLSLNETNRQWLAYKLLEPVKTSSNNTPIKPYTIEELRQRIIKAQKEVDEGKVIKGNEVMRMFDNFIETGVFA